MLLRLLRFFALLMFLLVFGVSKWFCVFEMFDFLSDFTVFNMLCCFELVEIVYFLCWLKYFCFLCVSGIEIASLAKEEESEESESEESEPEESEGTKVKTKTAMKTGMKKQKKNNEDMEKKKGTQTVITENLFCPNPNHPPYLVV